MLPTAHALVADRAFVLLSTLKPRWTGLGLGTRVQLAPFQCRIRVLEFSPPVPYTQPAAHASEADIALTPVRKLPSVTSGLGLGICIQLVPSQCSISVLFPPLEVP
jgi:hypothetical protein